MQICVWRIVEDRILHVMLSVWTNRVDAQRSLLESNRAQGDSQAYSVTLQFWARGAGWSLRFGNTRSSEPGNEAHGVANEAGARHGVRTLSGHLLLCCDASMLSPSLELFAKAH